ncbi:MAG TPA: hypothetical protein VMV05_08315 [bacterium]|nr:hypothetical protein [bacterium]
MVKKLSVFVGFALILSLLLIGSRAALAGESPIKGGGNFGLGLELGDPGNWGAVGKLWVDRQNAFQPAIKLGNGQALLQLDYLWHDYDIFHPNKGLLPLYFGAGGNLWLQNTVAVGARGVVGISYMFNEEKVPVDIYVQIVPEIWFYTGGVSRFFLYGDVGARYYF